jgi:hypothetical protein
MDFTADALLSGSVSQPPKVGQPGGIALPEPIEDFTALHELLSAEDYYRYYTQAKLKK